jgi:hypothetical protein
MNAADDAAEALMVLRDVMGWSLVLDRWAFIDKSVAALTAALAVDDAIALQDAVTSLELLGPVRGRAAAGALASPVPAPDEIREHLESAIRILQELREPAPADLRSFPVTIFLSDDAIHDQVERAVDFLVESAGLIIASRQPPVIGSWFRRMRAALRSPAGEEVLATAAHAVDSRLVLRPDAEVTAMLLQNLAPVITALQPSKDAAVRVGALLIVKVDWTVVVHQLTPRQQLVLDHSPGLEAVPDQILHALGLPPAEPGSRQHEPSQCG